MIIVTGLGRSGTSLVAQLYRELGFDPGGLWHRRIRGGFEAPDIVRVNRRITRDLGVGLLGVQKRPLRKVVQKSLRKVRKGQSPFLPRPGSLAAWERFEPAVQRYGAELRDLAKSHAVVKDPRFCSTLRVWAAAGAEIDYVLVTVRRIDAAARSIIAAGWGRKVSEDLVRNGLVYRLGLCMTALYEYGIEHRVVSFPDLVLRPEVLFDAMRFPRPVTSEQFQAAFERVIRPDLVTELRAGRDRESMTVEEPTSPTTTEHR